MSVIAKARQGDAQAWQALYEKVTPKLVVFVRARLYLGFESEEDIVADTWLLLAQRIHEFKGDDERQFLNWAFTVAQNYTLNSNRKTARRKTDTSEAVPEKAAWEQDWLGVEAILSLLPEREREIIVLADLLGFTSKEVGKILSLSSTNVRVIRSRALKKLRAELGENLLSQ